MPVTAAPSRLPKRFMPALKPSGSSGSYSNWRSLTLSLVMPEGCRMRRPRRGDGWNRLHRARRKAAREGERAARTSVQTALEGAPEAARQPPQLQDLALPGDRAVDHPLMGGDGAAAAVHDELDHEPDHADQEQDQTDRLDRDPGDGGGDGQP